MEPAIRPLSGPGAARRVAPFAMAASVGFFTLFIQGDASSPRLAVLAVALAGVTIAAAFTLPWQRWPARLETLPAYVFLGVIGLLRHAEGGAASGFGPLVLLPVLFVALYATRADLVVVVFASTVLFLGPVLLLDETRYPDAEWRRGTLWLVVGGIMGTTVQQLTAEARNRARVLAVLADASRSLVSTPNSRDAICQAAGTISEADFTVLLEPEDGSYVATAAAGISLPSGIRVPADHPVSGTARAFASGQPVFAPDAAASLVSSAFAAETAVVSAHFEPVVRDGRTIAVLLLAFTSPRRQLLSHAAEAIAVLAGDAGIAIERADLLSRLAAQATTDPLTGIANRRRFDETLSHEIDRSRRSEAPLSLAIIDLDHFKRFNDTHGHSEGDRLLTASASAWLRHLRPTDLLARYGGEEFAVVLPDARVDYAFAVADRLREALPSAVTCSIGVAEWDGAEGAEALVNRADRALYAAKEAGRNRVARALPSAGFLPE